jgi:protein O-mannosyl-transferase
MPPAKEPSRVSAREFHGPPLLSSRISSLATLGCILFVFAVYSRSLDFQFVLDDHRFTADPRIQDSGHIWDYFANYVWAQFTGGPPSFYRPLFLLWMRINFVLSALSPWGWHLLSLAKHVLVAALLGTLAWKLLRDSTAALVAATLFALHPAQTESVSWVTVPDPLMSAGVLGSLLCYLKYREGDIPAAKPTSRRKLRKTEAKTPRRSIFWLAASAAAYFAALLAKETAIVFPALIVALEIVGLEIAGSDRGVRPSLNLPKGRAQSARASSGVSKIGVSSINLSSINVSGMFRHLAPFLGVTVLYLLMRFNALGSALGTATQHLPWRTVVLSWPTTLWFYEKVLLWPIRSYSFADPTLVETFSVRTVLLPLLGLAGAALVLSGLLFLSWRKARRDLDEQRARGVETALVGGTLLLSLPLLLVLNLNALNPGDFLHGRYTYLPLAGLMLLVAAWSSIIWGSMAGKLRPLLLCAGAALAIVFAGLTFAQQQQWKDDATVFTVGHELAPRNAPVAQHLADTHVDAALKLGDEGHCTQAVPMLEQVTSDYPKDWYAWAGLGVCYVQLNDLAKAEESLHRAADISHDPRVNAQWQELRAHMGLPSSVSAK